MASVVEPTPHEAPIQPPNPTDGIINMDEGNLNPSSSIASLSFRNQEDLFAAFAVMLSNQQTLTDQLSSLNSYIHEQASQIESLRLGQASITSFIQANQGYQATQGIETSSPFRVRSPPTKRIKGADSMSDTSKLYMANLNTMFITQPSFEDNAGLIPPTLSNQGLQLISTSETGNRFSFLWKSMHNAAKMLAQDQRTTISDMASNKFLASIPLMKKVLSGGMAYEPLGCLISMESWKLEWGLAHFATPIETQDFITFKNQEAMEAQSDSLYAVDSIHATKKDLTMFYQTNFDKTIDSILSCVANFIVVASTIIVMPDPWHINPSNPVIINHFLDLAIILSSTDTKSRLMSATTRHPHLLFCVFSCFQDLLSEMGNILMRGKARDVALAMIGDDGFYFDDALFEAYFDQFKTSKSDLMKLAKTCSPPSAPLGYYTIHPVELKQLANPTPTYQAQSSSTSSEFTMVKPRGSKRQQPSTSASHIPPVGTMNQPTSNTQPPSTPATQPKGDWLEMSPGIWLKDLLPMPPNVRFCLHHAIKGIKCGRPTCRLRHVHYSDLEPATKASLETHLAAINNPTLKFKVVA